MERIYFIEGLDCANCAAKLERHLNEIPYFEKVVIDFMKKKLILTVQDEINLQKGLEEAESVIDRIEPGVTITEKFQKEKKRKLIIVENHEAGKCSCGHEHHVYNHLEHSSDEHCDCGHEHHHHNHSVDSDEWHTEVVAAELEGIKYKNNFTKEMKDSLLKVSISTILFAIVMVLTNLDIVQSDWIQLGMYLLAYLIVGGEVLLRAGKNIVRGQLFDENFLMTVATIGAFCVGEYPEGVMVMLLYQVGELFQNYAVQRSRRSIADLMDIKPEVAHVREEGRYVDIEPEEVIIGDIIQIRPGEKVPLDGTVLEGHSMLDTVALTGESMPCDVKSGDFIRSGCINTSGVLIVRVEKEYEDSTVAKILDLVENASSKKAEMETFITRFARYYTPVVVMIAVILAIIPPLVLHEPFHGWVYRSLVFLVISCPCALVISIPLTFFSGLGVCSKHGILVKGSNYLETLARLETAVFDKTGTLTKGTFEVNKIYPVNITEEQLLYYAACAESISNHPIAEAIREANKKTISVDAIQAAEELTGYGIKAVVEGHTVLAGNDRLLERENISYQLAKTTGTVVYIAVDQNFCGWIAISDEQKPDAKDMIIQLKNLGVQQIVMLTGDSADAAEEIAGQLGITEVFSQLLPGEKVICLENLLHEKARAGSVAFTGDGLNDAPVLARADVGIAMGGLGSDAAIEAADVVIMNDQPSKLVDAVQIARKTRKIVMQNITFVLMVKFVVLFLGALGMATMWMAVFADVGVAFLAILNAVRIMRY